jgi:type 1 glutamine amidotransferase
MRHALSAGLVLAMTASSFAATPPQPPTGWRVLVFTKTTGFRHGSIPSGISMMNRLATRACFTVDQTEDATQFNATNLARYEVVVFLCTTGDILNATQQTAFENYIRAGGGFVGIHSATDTEYDWPFYGELVGAYFRRHPAIQQASVNLVDADELATRHLPPVWVRTDEWYDFRTNPSPIVNVLLRVDESTYTGGGMGADHPIAWQREYQGGRSFYTAGGHTNGTYSEPLFERHVLGGVLWAAGFNTRADCNSNTIQDACDILRGTSTDANGDGAPDECPCPADFNRDGTADFFDYLDFVAAFAVENPSADFNADGTVDFFDYLDFVESFDSGCP